MMAIPFPLPDGYKYKLIKNEVNDECIFRIKEVTEKDHAHTWLEQFQALNKSTWRVLRTYPNTGRQNAYKIDMRCAHSTNKRVQGSRPSKQTGCRATLQILIKRLDETVPAENLNRDWPTVITVRGAHNHELNTAEVLKYRDLSQTSLTKLKEFFRKGHNASSALETLKTDFLFEYGDKYYEIAADGYYVPSYSIVHKLFEKEFISEYGPFNDSDFENLIKQLDVYSSTSEGIAKFYKTSDNEHYFVVICSPIMQRVHKLSQTSELVLVDASGGMDKQRHRIYAFVTPTAAGGLPLGMIISDSEKQYVFHEALTKLKDIFPDDSFHGKKEPYIFLTDNDLKERAPIKDLFPNSILLLCQFHFLKSLWTWLCDRNHNIDSSHRQELYYQVKDVLYAKTIENAVTLHSKVISSPLSRLYDNFLHHYINLWEYRQEWATCFRQNLPLRGTNTTNFVEIVFRILKDCIFNRIMAFNLAQFVDYILIKYEIYLEKRLIDFSNGRCPRAIFKHFLPEFDPNMYELQNEDNGNYTVKNKYTNTDYKVDILSGICSCIIGLSGKICTHSSYVIASIGQDIETSFNLATKKTREIMLFIATGKKAPSNWHEPLQKKESNVRSENMDTDELVIEDVPKSIHNLHEPSSSSTLQNVIPSVSTEEKEKFNDLIKRIMNGVETAPEIYVPAFKKMIKNADKFATTEVGLITAMHTFGTYNGALAKTCARKIIKRSHANRIGVQPTAGGRRKKCLTGKKKLCVGRERGQAKVVPLIKCHDYTTFGSLPKRKRKAPHNLTDCVYSNKGLG